MRRDAIIGACLCALLTAALLFPASAATQPPDWSAAADVKTVFALTKNEDGSKRETKIWLIVVDGQGYIRTSHSTRWGRNVVRDPDIVLRVEGVEYPVRAHFVEDTVLRDRVVKAFREKYGWVDGFLGILRGSHPHIMRLEPRAQAP